MEIFGEHLREISNKSSELTYLVSIIDKHLEHEAYKGKYNFRLVQPKYHLENRNRKYLDEEVYEHFKELLEYYNSQGISLTYVVDSFQPRNVKGESVFDWSNK